MSKARIASAPGRTPALESGLRGHALLVAGLIFAAALASFTVSAGSAHAAFPGLNGRIACSGPLVPDAVPAGQSRLEIFSVNPDASGERRLTENTITESSPKYSPDGKRIAFSRAGQIWTMDADGGNEVQLTTEGSNTPGSWSPDGSRIVFQSTRDSAGGFSFEIYKMNADGSAVTRLTTQQGSDSLPAWSPDGTKIAFVSFRLGSNANIFVMDQDGTNVREAISSPAEESGPSWSPDGRQIAFHSDRDAFGVGRTLNRNLEIYRANADGSGAATRLTFSDYSGGGTSTDLTGYDIFPAWSPEGDRIVFHSGRAPENRTTGQAPFIAQWEVYTVDATYGEGVADGLRRLTNRAGNDERCDWQPLARPAAQPPAAPRAPAPPTPLAPFPECPASSANVIRATTTGARITGTVRGDRIFGGTGNDVVDALAGDDCVDLGTGDDRGQGGLGNDLMSGGLGDDVISGSSGNDRMRGNAGRDRVNGGRGNDRVFGDSGNDSLLGSFGNDRLHGVSGKDRISGSRGRDRINGGSSNDRISGGSSGDRIAGDAGHDRINGNSGADSISGNSGNDRITSADNSRDRVNCGRGRDSVLADRRDIVSRNCERVRRR